MPPRSCPPWGGLGGPAALLSGGWRGLMRWGVVLASLGAPTRARHFFGVVFVAGGSPSEGPVFLTQRGEPYHDPRLYKFPSGSPIKKAHATACRRAGVEDFNVHDWRHHWACQCVMAGIDLETIRQEGGWKS